MSPEQLFEKAAQLEDEGQEVTALQVWRKLVDTHPDPVSLCRLAWLADELGETEEAKGAFWRAIEAERGFSSAYIGLASIEIDQGNYGAAESFLKQALAVEEAEDAYSLLGVAQRHLGKIDEAKQSFREAIRINPAFDEAYYNFGVLVRNSDPSEAEALYLKALECKPDYAEAHRELGWQLNKRNSLVEAEQHLRRAIELRPDDAWGHTYLGNLLERRDDMGAAAAEYEWAHTAAPDRAFPLWSLANLYEDREDWEKAQPLYERALALEPDDAVGNKNLGRMLKKKGDLASAKEYLERALFIEPDYADAKNLLLEVQRLQRENPPNKNSDSGDAKT